MRIFDSVTADSEKMSMEDGGAGQGTEDVSEDTATQESTPDYQLELTDANGTPLRAEGCPFCGEDHSHLYEVETDKFPSLSFVNPFDHSVQVDVRCDHFRRLTHLSPGEKLSIYSHEIEAAEPFDEPSGNGVKGLTIGFRSYRDPAKAQELSAAFKQAFQEYATYMGLQDMDGYIEAADDIVRSTKPPLVGVVTLHICSAKGRAFLQNAREELQDSPLWEFLQIARDLASRPESATAEEFEDAVESLFETIGEEIEARLGPRRRRGDRRTGFPRTKFHA